MYVSIMYTYDAMSSAFIAPALDLRHDNSAYIHLYAPVYVYMHIHAVYTCIYTHVYMSMVPCHLHSLWPR
jgi:hypothetical protein